MTQISTQSAVAVVRAPLAPLHLEPRVSSPQVSQALAGYALDIIDTRDAWHRVRGADGYEGWLHEGYFTTYLVDDANGGRASALPRVTRTSLGCVVRAANGRHRALPLGALFGGDEVVVSGEAVTADELPRRFPAEASAIAQTAVERFESTSYQWGGVTPWGADCSGLVQSVFRLHGTALPRDAWQQAQLGTDAGRDIAALRPADLLFFSDRNDRRVTHVGVALGDLRMVHLALGRGGYAVERFGESTDAYAEQLLARFLHARRVIE
jgi:cell wall-associated NlpC family hydrolase